MTKEKYNIEWLKKEDIKIAVNLVRSSFKQQYLIPSIYRGKGIEKFISNEFDNPFSPYRYFILREGDVIAGYAEYKIFENTSTAFLNIISVSNEFKNKGIGSKLYQATKDFFIEQGFAAIALDVYDTNKAALRWYANFGFKQTSSNAFYEIKLESDNLSASNIFIQNFPQYKELHGTYGFYFLDIMIANENIRIGTIEQDLVVKAGYSAYLSKQLSALSKMLQCKKVYFIGNGNQFEGLEFMDNILRMELNIKL